MAMLPNGTWRVGAPDSPLLMHRWACTDGRYTWQIHGPCPLCGGHDVDEFHLGDQADPDIVQPILFVAIEDDCLDRYVKQQKQNGWDRDYWDWRRFVRDCQLTSTST